MKMYDAIVMGGSIAGLLAAREIARRRCSVLVLEEDAEIGTPEHCGGLVSRSALRSLAIDEYTVLSRVRHATITVRDVSIEMDAERQDVIAVDRRALDKYVARQASRDGADVMLMCRARSFAVHGDHVRVDTSRGVMECRVLVDARGCAVPASSGRGFLPSAQYEIDSAAWIEDGRVEVHIDQEMYPGFFAWVIPSGSGRGRVGVAGKGINVASRIEGFIATREMAGYANGDVGSSSSNSSSNSSSSNGNCCSDHNMIHRSDGRGSRCVTLRKVFAPIWVDGPRRPFVRDGRVVIVGDAAGQAKPTTAGGIYTSGMGGVLAGTAIAEALTSSNLAMLSRYEDEWLNMFGREFERMLMLRRLFERLDNRAIGRILLSVGSYVMDEVSASGDFDFHSSALARMLMSRDGLSIARAILGSEFRRLIGIAKI
ncbi:MAG: NAD(P)/FAD-dependent oxidoreductase [Candidatus Nitrosocaldus sp.]|nr:NAD(P)/FAD-dependent oxidoreductase [Candidatus Nitrosocaldus sp.]MDW7999648.1 NAD(P)/FAD-dependent oxidoreductase [Candidatus Nitrosocaldus sp.]MDW8275302.1 NAD(P)/FAD-dependent oxidoreductase [Candidatus Nitrosocaldus sp.]